MLRSSQDELDRPAPQTLLVDLMLASGSRAGIAVSVHPGYYLIGRDSECQIRPKSRSVSRRHCLLRREAGKLHAVDLESTSGTRLNGERLKPRCWYPLADGDQLRCGKIAFDVRMQVVAEPAADASADSPAGTAQSLAVTGPAAGGQAWQAEDIADWMTGFDELEQAERIQGIRGQAVPADDSLQSFDSSATEEGLATEEGVASAAESQVDAPASRAPAPASHSAAPANNPSARSSKRQASKPLGARLALPSLAISGDREKLKMLAVGLLLVLAISWLAWSFFASGTDDIYQQIKPIDS